jgi:predicted transcriptional regulator
MSEPDPTDTATNSPERYPETLRITVAPPGTTATAAKAHLDTDGPAVEGIRAFDSVDEIWQILTARRLELMRSIMTAPPDSISDLADRLGRNYSDVHADVAVLADHDIVYFDTDGRAKKPVIPYERVRVDIEVVGDADTSHAVVS